MFLSRPLTPLQNILWKTASPQLSASKLSSKRLRQQDVWAAFSKPKKDVSKPLNNEKYRKLQHRRTFKWPFKSLRENTFQIFSASLAETVMTIYLNSSVEMVAEVQWEALLQRRRAEVETGPALKLHSSLPLCVLLHESSGFDGLSVGASRHRDGCHLQNSYDSFELKHPHHTGRWAVRTRTHQNHN